MAFLALTSRCIQGLGFLDPRVRKKMVQSPSFERESDDGEGLPTTGLRISLRWCQRASDAWVAGDRLEAWQTRRPREACGGQLGLRRRNNLSLIYHKPNWKSLKMSRKRL
ncbi:uncharacterized protein [Gossypium hirsutum]|uniref:Uncharacterized protein n=1 Tax=Gossypium hirsutum TaxID=3635 RepID=A0ABM2ZXF0_GOSHI|nr:uncharacterized protein LOC121216073 [Gossypium hirsutum]